MKGAVILIGSLLWENSSNSIEKEKGKMRMEWRENLDISRKSLIEVPIRYGRKSRTRRDTYTMVFSNSIQYPGKAYLVPFKNEAKNFEEVKLQAIGIAKAEGISTKKNPDRLISSWGTIGIAFNIKNEEKLIEIRSKWHNEFRLFDNSKYGVNGEIPTIQKNGELNFQFKIPKDIDYVFATTVTPELKQYPDIEEIVNAVNNSNPRYDTYIIENFNHGIRVFGDEEILFKIR